jgi:hypothetical protein
MIVNCRRFVEILTAARERALPEWEEKHFEEHRGHCRMCRSYAEDFERTVELLGDLAPQQAPETLRAELLARFRKTTGGPRD